MSSIFLTHETARAFWKSPIEPSAWTRSRRQTWPQDNHCPSSELSENARAALASSACISIDDAIHALVATDSKRRTRQGTVCHVCNATLPEGSFVRIGKGVYVASPELWFAQEAKRLSFPEAVLLGFEICGQYCVPDVAIRETSKRTGNDDFRKSEFESTPPDDSESTFSSKSESTRTNVSRNAETQYRQRGFFDRAALTTPDRIRMFLNQARGLPGTRAARTALPHIIKGSASPMESVAAMLLCLPPHRGGFGLDKPVMNARIDMNGRLSPLSASPYYECDLFWPQAKLAVEYDSELEHANSRQLSRDARKRVDLAARGITVISLTKQQVLHIPSMEQVAREIARITGKRLRKETCGLTDSRIELRKALIWDRLK